MAFGRAAAISADNLKAYGTKLGVAKLLFMNDNHPPPDKLVSDPPPDWQGVLFATAALVSSLCALLLAFWMSV
ncbi:hypothetical protein EN904_15400 [Mesorhizobium sp. M7A.F.Ca.CA.001.07.2.1]|uniref:hypothetical protein n=1 Tax=Mesorhizobium TaxID=68287 RepID=UPI000FCC83BD|nr:MULTISPECIES: hypothetical protein [Mesorhizobium]RVB27227.1 hypothetical protein EN918_25215 [Mesorhizobium sp. M7A.F.Ca.CA.004.05.1.1]MCF6125728.1 hypothetical protein [Mesorhizobium ciceri]MCQ8817912.1 hypothetical protein [Mesorhizobium sp. SEMIA396]RUX67921.1 hypothetical protein EN983_30555 [Mesorhizobium sp. M7A.F.Ca.CA.004.08.2.1]RUX88435.1 hypothetical protein EN982_06415 [Mesorhizobium sp. M7A.F.Ca.CA.004.08.1.1]